MDITESVIVAASRAAVWRTVLNAVEEPLKYHPLAVRCEVAPHPSGGSLHATDVFGLALRERVTVDAGLHTVRYVHEPGSAFEGFREVRVEAAEGRESGPVALHLSARWAPVSDRAKGIDPGGLGRLARAWAERMKSFAEGAS